VDEIDIDALCDFIDGKGPSPVGGGGKKKKKKNKK